MRHLGGWAGVALGWVLFGCLPGNTGGVYGSGGSGSSGGGAGSSGPPSTSYRALPDAGPPLPGLCGAGPVDAGTPVVPGCSVGTAGAEVPVIAWERGGASRVWTHAAGLGWAPGPLLAPPFDRVLAWLPLGNVGIVESAGGARAVRISDGTELATLVEPGWQPAGFALAPPTNAGDPWMCAFSSETGLPDATLNVTCVKPVSGSVQRQVLALGTGQLHPGPVGTLNGELLFVVRRPDANGAHHDELMRLRPWENSVRVLLSADEYLGGSVDGWPGRVFSGVTQASLNGGPPEAWVVATDIVSGEEVARMGGRLASGAWDGDTFASNVGTVLVVDETGTAWAWDTLFGFSAAPVGVAGDPVHALSARGGFAVVGLAPVSTALFLMQSTGAVTRVLDDRDCTLGGTQVHLRALGLNAWGDSVWMERSEFIPDAGHLPRGLSLSRADGCRLDFPDGRVASNHVQLFTASSARGRAAYWWAADEGSVNWVDDLPMGDMQVFRVPTFP